jgi:hypothetical protein
VDIIFSGEGKSPACTMPQPIIFEDPEEREISLEELAFEINGGKIERKSPKEWIIEAL